MRAELTWIPALTAREVRMEAADKTAGRHWTGPAGCWCESRHQAGEALTLAAPVWDESRRAEPIAAVAG